jgi:hypothetical protein
MVRDLAPDLLDPNLGDNAEAQAALDPLIPDLLERAWTVINAAEKTREATRRLIAQVGSEAAMRRLPVILNALKNHGLLDKAQAFGRATNGMQEELALDRALQAMPFHDQPLAALLMQATVGQCANPTRLALSVIRIVGSASEIAIRRQNFAPVIDAILAHAQNQIPIVSQVGPFADIDLICRAIDRFHRLMRAINSYIEVSRNGRWAMIGGAITAAVSERIEPRMRDVLMDVNKALRRHRDGADRLDSDQVLSALNGIYVMTTVRDCRDSLALNALFDQTWAQVGQALEIHIERNIENYRANPRDRIIGERLEAAIKMAELRFNLEYAEVLRRAKDAAEKR